MVLRAGIFRFLYQLRVERIVEEAGLRAVLVLIISVFLSKLPADRHARGSSRNGMPRFAEASPDRAAPYNLVRVLSTA